MVDIEIRISRSLGVGWRSVEFRVISASSDSAKNNSSRLYYLSRWYKVVVLHMFIPADDVLSLRIHYNTPCEYVEVKKTDRTADNLKRSDKLCL